jgi:hypothetical protein
MHRDEWGAMNDSPYKVCESVIKGTEMNKETIPIRWLPGAWK